MKWVWSEDKAKALDITTGNILLIQGQVIINSLHYTVWFQANNPQRLNTHINTFDTLQAAQEFITNLTGAVNGGSHD